MYTRASQPAGRAIINIIKNFNNGTHRLSNINPNPFITVLASTTVDLYFFT